MNSGVSFSVNRALLFEQYVIMSTPIFTRNNLSITQLPIGFHVASNSNKLGKSIWLDKFGEAAVKTPSNSLCFFLSSLSRLASSPLRYLILPAHLLSLLASSPLCYLILLSALPSSSSSTRAAIPALFPCCTRALTPLAGVPRSPCSACSRRRRPVPARPRRLVDGCSRRSSPHARGEGRAVAELRLAVGVRRPRRNPDNPM